MKNRHFLLVIVCLLSIKGPLTSTSAGTGIPPNDLILSTEDYSIFEDSSTPIVPVIEPTNAGTLQWCDYNACREKQTPCEVLSTSLGCLCPGFTLHNQHPEPPSLSSVSWNGSAVVVWWCAPNSYITSYVVTVEGGEKQTLRADQRRAALSQIDHKAEVCVVAVNYAGDSARSCMEYQPSSNSLALTVGLIGGTLGFLLLILLAVLLCRRRRQKKEEARHV
ncbi:hypothetical protein CHARACLAT_003937 [Characodon lateralis]|uniref:Epidermal growth factor receptor-like transmembrane-juxtamembrane segment domain-containing protein n=1 Tax=Characodon lateralis TaxID=208331 RepID=A0ABU7CNH3_9TELE|nr:hypothetical protein [Characodon lateralis]